MSDIITGDFQPQKVAPLPLQIYKCTEYHDNFGRVIKERDRWITSATEPKTKNMVAEFIGEVQLPTQVGMALIRFPIDADCIRDAFEKHDAVLQGIMEENQRKAASQIVLPGK